MVVCRARDTRRTSEVLHAHGVGAKAENHDADHLLCKGPGKQEAAAGKKEGPLLLK